MLRLSLTTLMCICLLIIACGEEPPEEFYEGTPEDSTAIAELLGDNPVLLKTEDMFNPIYIPTYLPNVSWPVADSYFRVDSTIIKQHVDSCGLSLGERKDTLDFWFAKDTTCTVYLFDTFTVASLMHADVKYIGYYDHLIDTIIDTLVDSTVVPWDTTYDTLYDVLAKPKLGTIEFDSTPYYSSLEYTGSGRRLIFFEPERDTVQLVDSTVVPWDTTYTYKLIEPFNWLLRRISYGIYYFPEQSPDLADIVRVILTDTAGVADTIRASSYDTLYTGHAMDRLRALDSLLQFDNGETVTVDIEVSLYGADALDCAFFAACGGHERINLSPGNETLELVGDGITNLYFEAVLKDVFYYVQPEKAYQSVVWLVPVMIGGVQ